uniref:serine--tRNA ligase n=1 Tax=Meloidogyne hapla TaxID=6305 RepID=A0A1I8B8E1_MELHA
MDNFASEKRNAKGGRKRKEIKSARRKAEAEESKKAKFRRSRSARKLNFHFSGVFYAEESKKAKRERQKQKTQKSAILQKAKAEAEEKTIPDMYVCYYGQNETLLHRFITIQNFCLNSQRALVEEKINPKYENRIMEYFGGIKREESWIKSAEKLVDGWGVIRWPRHSSGGRNYALLGVSATRACGVPFQTGQNPMQYRVYYANDLYNGQKQIDLSDDLDFCLSGTAEMGIANQIKNRIFQQDQLPTYFLAESTCFRPEISCGHLECGLYRVHQFKKVEIFVVCTEKQSLNELQRIVGIQKNLFSSLGLHCRLLDMCEEELGASASQKFDIEAWMPGRREWGEISSASNCTDYQSQRLKIFYRQFIFLKRENFKYKNSLDGSSKISSLRHVYTSNGTGIASARTIIALLESFQFSTRHDLQLPELIKKMLPTERSSVLKCGIAPPITYCFDNDQY